MTSDSREFETMLNEIIDRKVKSILKGKNYEVPYDGYVESVVEDEENANPYSQYAYIIVAGYENITLYLKNLTGEMLSVGDRVKIYTSDGNLSNGYIGIKCG